MGAPPPAPHSSEVPASFSLFLSICPCSFWRLPHCPPIPASGLTAWPRHPSPSPCSWRDYAFLPVPLPSPAGNLYASPAAVTRAHPISRDSSLCPPHQAVCPIPDVTPWAVLAHPSSPRLRTEVCPSPPRWPLLPDDSVCAPLWLGLCPSPGPPRCPARSPSEQAELALCRLKGLASSQSKLPEGV